MCSSDSRSRTPRKLVVRHAEAENPQGHQEAFPPHGKRQGKTPASGHEPSGHPNEPKTQAKPARHCLHERRRSEEDPRRIVREQRVETLAGERLPAAKAPSRVLPAAKIISPMVGHAGRAGQRFTGSPEKGLDPVRIREVSQ